MNTKEFRATVKSAKIDLKKEVTSISYWIGVIAKAAKRGDCMRAVKHLLAVEKLPKIEEVKKALLQKAKTGYKFYSEDGEILVCKKSFKKDSSGKIIRENDAPIVEKTWYEKKVSFTFDSVWNATFSPSKTRVTIPDAEIK